MIVNVKVKTNQKKFSLNKEKEPWVISVIAKPEKNAANNEILRELSEIFSSVRILRGKKSPRKTLEIKA